MEETNCTCAKTTSEVIQWNKKQQRWQLSVLSHDSSSQKEGNETKNAEAATIGTGFSVRGQMDPVAGMLPAGAELRSVESTVFESNNNTVKEWLFSGPLSNASHVMEYSMTFLTHTKPIRVSPGDYSTYDKSLLVILHINGTGAASDQLKWVIEVEAAGVTKEAQVVKVEKAKGQDEESRAAQYRVEIKGAKKDDDDHQSVLEVLLQVDKWALVDGNAKGPVVAMDHLVEAVDSALRITYILPEFAQGLTTHCDMVVLSHRRRHGGDEEEDKAEVIAIIFGTAIPIGVVLVVAVVVGAALLVRFKTRRYHMYRDITVHGLDVADNHDQDENHHTITFS